MIGAAFGLGFIFGPALSGVLAQVSYTAPIWAAAAIDARRDRRGLVLAARDRFIARTLARQCRSASLPALLQAARPPAASSSIDFVYWFAFAIFQTTFALFAARRFRLRRLADRVFLRGVRRSRRRRAGRIHSAGRAPARRQTDVHRRACVCSAIGLVAATLTHSVGAFAFALVAAGAWGSDSATRRCRASSAAPLATTSRGAFRARRQRSRSLGRTIGPVWGNASLQRFGEGTPSSVGGVCLLMVTLVLEPRLSGHRSRPRPAV